MRVNSNGNVLIVDDEPNAVKVLSAILSADAYRVFESNDVESAIRVLNKRDIDAVITDLKMPGKDGMHFFDYIQENSPDIPVIFLTAFGTVESAVHAMTNKAFYYFIKPPDYEKLKGILSRAVEQRLLKRELETLRRKLSAQHGPNRIFANTLEMVKIFETIEAVKDSASSVLVCGDTGTGKELIARLLHYSSLRSEKPFVAVNCAAIPRELIESELFGYEKGAFTGAVSRRVGKFEEAAGGTIFLDEIGELELPLQAKLLRVLQEREIERLGSNKKVHVNFRLVSSTNRDLNAEIQSGYFREDLFYRINVVQITVPTLKDRKDDIPLLVSEFVKEFCILENKMLTVTDEVMDVFWNHPWPGNVRQLKNVIERAVVLAKGDKITLRHLPDGFIPEQKKPRACGSYKTLKELELQAIKDALQEHKGNKSKAAKVLGISRKTFYKRLKELQII
ncbi:MAG: two component sigma54 specific Fis family transcriptional [Geobacteraceae bacterium]|nr:MAG: two component sigma54 specific Fis family transcriptional [Geobacteraceae bacterium]